MRFGSAELYDVLDTCFPPGNPLGAGCAIIDCLAVGQSIEDGTDERVILFVKLPDGELLSEAFEKRMKSEVRARRSPRHVPAVVSNAPQKVLSWRVDAKLGPLQIIQVQDVPYTLNGKRVEVPVKKVRLDFELAWETCLRLVDA